MRISNTSPYGPRALGDVFSILEVNEDSTPALCKHFHVPSGLGADRPSTLLASIHRTDPPDTKILGAVRTQRRPVSRLSLILGATNAFAYNHILYSTIWNDVQGTVYYRILTTFDETTKTQFVTATEQWNTAVDYTFLAKSVSTTNLTFTSNDGYNTLTKRGNDGVLGEHYPYTNSSGRIVESDIRVNSTYAFANSAKPGYYDIQSLLTHELGHAVRLGHSSSTADTMYDAQSTNNSSWRTITADDTEAAQESYARWVD